MSPAEIKALRALLRVSQAGLAAGLGVPMNTVARWECRMRTPDAPTRRLLRLLKADPTLWQRLLVMDT